ncbi:FtsQ-type POTRA domain-containing protein [Clavibacter michiganensis subsp. tessellarius]|uniref:FtsQ-type POTRA domain-containing protein n=1 Tax=Clavibacter tessellarius TaxID=31965 RepID=UPI002351ECC3|nr:FtsQ-type POTRA domain-containing protein [Clavibacter michiganensis]
MKRPEGFDRPRVPRRPAPADGAEAPASRRRGSRPASPPASASATERPATDPARPAPQAPQRPPAQRPAAPRPVVPRPVAPPAAPRTGTAPGVGTASGTGTPARTGGTPPAADRPRAAWRDDDEPDTEPIVLPHLAQAPVTAPPAPSTGREPTASRAGGIAGRLGRRARGAAQAAGSTAAKPLRRRTHAEGDAEPTPRAHRPARPASATTGDAEARRQLRRARRERQRYERQEVRRFTQRTRRRRAGLLGALGAFLVLAIVVGIAVYSPLLALRTVEVEGADRVSPDSIQAALADQVGTPLPLVDLGRVGDELRAFPLIRSYSTESRPPSTLVIRIVERTPVAVIQSGAGFDLVDPAGVTIERATARPDGYPLVDLPSADLSSPRFRAATAVLVALPADFLPQVDGIQANTTDDVMLTLRSGKKVLWGSGERSAEKAQVLQALVKARGDVGSYDVSAPDAPVAGP